MYNDYKKFTVIVEHDRSVIEYTHITELFKHHPLPQHIACSTPLIIRMITSTDLALVEDSQ